MTQRCLTCGTDMRMDLAEPTERIGISDYAGAKWSCTNPECPTNDLTPNAAPYCLTCRPTTQMVSVGVSPQRPFEVPRTVWQCPKCGHEIGRLRGV